jgi:predicted NBD/HSP70 family sugar kinase
MLCYTSIIPVNGVIPMAKSPQVKTANLQQVKAANRSLVFGLIYRDGTVSRAGLTARTHLSPTTVSSLVDELIDLGLVYERGPSETTGSGRKPVMVSVNPGGGYFASAELTRDGFDLALYDLNCKELGRSSERVVRYSVIGVRLIRAIEQLMSGCGLEEKRLNSICIGAPAIIDPDRKVIIVSTVLPMKPGKDFIAELRSRFPGIPIRLENESGLRCYAEMEYGAVTGIRDLLFIDIDIGIGSALILDGHLYRGSSGRAGEIGHVSIDYDGPACACGNKGCLELMANVPSLIRRVVSGMEKGKPSVIGELTGGETSRVDLETLRMAAERGDPVVCHALDETARLLASGINSVLNILNPQAIVIGGKMAELGQVLFDPLETHLARIALQPVSGSRSVYKSSLTGDAATLGGARLLLDEYLRQPGLGHAGRPG